MTFSIYYTVLKVHIKRVKYLEALFFLAFYADRGRANFDSFGRLRDVMGGVRRDSKGGRQIRDRHIEAFGGKLWCFGEEMNI